MLKIAKKLDGLPFRLPENSKLHKKISNSGLYFDTTNDNDTVAAEQCESNLGYKEKANTVIDDDDLFFNHIFEDSYQSSSPNPHNCRRTRLGCKSGTQNETGFRAKDSPLGSDFEAETNLYDRKLKHDQEDCVKTTTNQ